VEVGVGVVVTIVHVALLVACFIAGFRLGMGARR